MAKFLRHALDPCNPASLATVVNQPRRADAASVDALIKYLAVSPELWDIVGFTSAQAFTVKGDKGVTRHIRRAVVGVLCEMVRAGVIKLPGIEAVDVGDSDSDSDDEGGSAMHTEETSTPSKRTRSAAAAAAASTPLMSKPMSAPTISPATAKAVVPFTLSELRQMISKDEQSVAVIEFMLENVETLASGVQGPAQIEVHRWPR
jgi:hypothetical protein